MIDKLKSCFNEMLVYKDLKKNNFFSALSLPSFMRDWLLKKFEDENGNFDLQKLNNFIHKYLPNKNEWTTIKNRIIREQERVRLLAKINVDIDIKTGEVSFDLPDFGLSSKDTIIENSAWQECKEDLLSGQDIWGIVELGYRQANKYDKNSKVGKIKLINFTLFCPYTIDLDYYKEARREFTIDEWLDILLGAIDYNAAGYLGDNKLEKKLTMLTRLLPFVQQRLNLIELAPKGTGKSYLFGNVSRFGWLSSGGVMSRAKMFYDQNKRVKGLICTHDFITLDEVQTISFTDADEMRAALKGYLEMGKFTIGNYAGEAKAGIVLCGNIKKETMDGQGWKNMFYELPHVFHESALIERFHGFIKGWDIPRMNDDLKISDWALNSEYFCSVLHQLRDDLTYREVVEELVETPKAADTRDTEAIKRIATAYLKLLFPNVKSPKDITGKEFDKYCLKRAKDMRHTIITQLGLLDDEYKGKVVPNIKVHDKFM